MSNDALAGAPALIDQIQQLLQEAHFAARALEDVIPQHPADRYPDRIHRVRRLAETLRVELEALAQRSNTACKPREAPRPIVEQGECATR